MVPEKERIKPRFAFDDKGWLDYITELRGDIEDIKDMEVFPEVSGNSASLFEIGYALEALENQITRVQKEASSENKRKHYHYVAQSRQWEKALLDSEAYVNLFRSYAKLELLVPYVSCDDVCRVASIRFEYKYNQLCKNLKYFNPRVPDAKIIEFYNNASEKLRRTEQELARETPVIIAVVAMPAVAKNIQEYFNKDMMSQAMRWQALEENLFGLKSLLDIKNRMDRIEEKISLDKTKGQQYPWLSDRYLWLQQHYDFLWNVHEELRHENNQILEGKSIGKFKNTDTVFEVLQNVAEERKNFHIGLIIIEAGKVLQEAIKTDPDNRKLADLIPDWENAFLRYQKFYLTSQQNKNSLEVDRGIIVSYAKDIEDSVYFISKGEKNDTPYRPQPRNPIKNPNQESPFVKQIRKIYGKEKIMTL